MGAVAGADLALDQLSQLRVGLTSSYAIQVDNELTEELTKTEWRVIQKIGCGMSNKEIASELALSEGTVRNYLSSVLSKLELRDRTQLAIWAVQTGAVNRYIGE